jgi:hypothetical protein
MNEERLEKTCRFKKSTFLKTLGLPFLRQLPKLRWYLEIEGSGFEIHGLGVQESGQNRTKHQ